MTVVDWTIQRRVDGGIIRAGFTSRAGGVSTGEYASLNLGPHVGDAPAAVARNRGILSDYLECEPGWMEQVHGAHVARARPGTTSERTDALILGESANGASRAACVMVADCVPLLLVSASRLRAAAVHVGRAGFMNEIALVALEALGEPPGDLTAIVGPSICGRCYEVPEAMREQARAMAPSSASQTAWGTPSIDIPAGLTEQLNRAGVLDVVVDGRCTMEDSRFHSHRRSSRAGLSAGRFAGVVHLRSDTPA